MIRAILILIVTASILPQAVAAPPSVTPTDTRPKPGQLDRWNGARFAVPLVVEQLQPRKHGGLPRVDEPVSIGVPIPDDVGITDVSELTVQGVSHYQIRPLGYWAESGNLKWVLVDFLASVEPGGRREGIVLARGEGMTPAPSIAQVENGRIVLDTGRLWVKMQRSGTNFIDKIKVDGEKVVGGEDVFRLSAFGMDGTEFPATVPEGAKLEVLENGPVKAVVVAKGAHRSADGEHLFDFELRMTAFRGQRALSCEYTIKNGSKESPRHVQHRGIHLNLATRLGDEHKKLQYRFPMHQDPFEARGELEAQERAYYYCSYNNSSQVGVHDVRTSPSNEGWVPPVPYDSGSRRFAEEGYRIVENGVDIQSQTRASEYTEVTYGAVEAPDGPTVAASIRFAARYWPVSYDVHRDRRGRTTLDIGLFSGRAAGPHVVNFLQHQTREFALYFSSAHESPYPRAYMEMYPLMARLADVRHVNRCNVIPDRLVTLAEENDFMEMAGLGLQVAPRNEDFSFIRFWDAGQGGGLNQLDITYHYLVRYWRTGDAGAFLSAKAWADYRSDWAVVRSDDWVHCRNGDPRFEQPVPDNDGAFLTAAGHIFDNQHRHTRGLPLIYYFTGNPRYRDAFLEDTETVTFSDRVTPGYLNTRIVAMLIKAGMRGYSFIGEVDRLVGFSASSPYPRSEVYEKISRYLRTMLDARYDFAQACSGAQPKGWSDEPGQTVQDARRFFFAGGDRLRNEEPKFHLFSMLPDTFWNYQFHAPDGDPNVNEMRTRVLDLEHYFWSTLYSPCEEDPFGASIGETNVRLFDDNCQIPPTVLCASGDDFHPAYALEAFAYRITEDSHHLERGRHFMLGQHLGSNQLVNYNIHRTDFQNFIYQHNEHEPDVAPPVTRALRTIKPIDEPVVIKWETDEPTIGKVVYWSDGDPEETPFESDFSRAHAWSLDTLTPHDDYRYFVLNQDSAGNHAVSARRKFLFDDFRADTRHRFEVLERNGGRLNYSRDNGALRFRGGTDSKVWMYLNREDSAERGAVSFDYFQDAARGSLYVMSVLLMEDWSSYYEATFYGTRTRGGGIRVRKIVDDVVVDKICSEVNPFELPRTRPKLAFRKSEIELEMRGADFELYLATPSGKGIDVQRVLIVVYQADAWLDNLLFERG